MKVIDIGNRLENILKEFLNCEYNDFGVKSNDNLCNSDWKSPINFALGYRYALSNQDPSVKESIDYFLGNSFIGENIGDVIHEHLYYGLDTKEDAISKVNSIIDELENILKQ